MSASANGWLEDTSKVQKYVMSDDAYNQREGTYRQYKQMRRKVCPSQHSLPVTIMGQVTHMMPPKSAGLLQTTPNSHLRATARHASRLHVQEPAQVARQTLPSHPAACS